MTQPITVAGVTYKSKRAATIALFQAGEDLQRIVELTGSTIGAVRFVLRGMKRAAPKPKADPATRKGTWTPEKRDKARRLFGKTMIYIAEAINVPPREFLTYVLHGVVPPSQEIAEPDDIRWDLRSRALRIEFLAAQSAELVAGEDDRAVDADHLLVQDEPGREDDEAELSRLEAEEAEPDFEPDPTKGLGVHRLTKAGGERGNSMAAAAYLRDGKPLHVAAGGEVKGAPPAPVGRFQDQAPAAQAGKAAQLGGQAAGQLICLMDEMGRYLHESLDGMTTNPRFAWRGGADKVKIITNRMPHLRELDQVAFGK